MPILMSSTFRPDGGRRLPAARPGPRRQPEGDRPPLAPTTPTRTTPSTTTWTGSSRRSSPCWTRRRRPTFSDDPEELLALAGLGGRFRTLDKKVLHNAVRLLTGSAADFLDDYFESDILKGYLASSAIIGTKVGPRSQGSGLVLLYHLLGEHDGVRGAWSFHKGGNGGFTQVLARAARRSERRSGLESPVATVITKDGRATGVALAGWVGVPRPGGRLRAGSAPDVPRAG